jgi:hypothetical protein
MIGLLHFVLAVVALPFKSKLRLEAENAALRHQLIVLRRTLHGRVRLKNPRSAARWCRVRRPLQSRPTSTPGAMDTLAPSRWVTGLAARQRALPDAEIHGVQISWLPSH